VIHRPALDAATLRAEFDHGFALRPVAPDTDVVDLLAIRAGSHRVAIRLGDILAIAATPRLLAVPSTAPALLGLAGQRGQIVAVFRLATLLGHPELGTARWMVICGGAGEPIALAFEELDGHHRLSRARLHVEAAQIDDELRPLVDVRRLVAAINARPGRALRTRRHDDG